MNTPTYRQQFDKLTKAYINGEVDPWDCKACFVGNLLNNKDEWQWLHCGGDKLEVANENLVRSGIKLIKSSGYSVDETYQLERNFLVVLNEETVDDHEISCGVGAKCHRNYEKALFTAFESTLELLKQIHISKGEGIEDVPVFQKRVFQIV